MYTRWGRTVCPDTADVVYKGEAAGSWYQSGGGANLQCFPENPGYLNTTKSEESKLYGVEFEVSGSQWFGVAKQMHNKNMPCVVCQTKSRATTLMSPATTQCHDGSWTFEYNGYLMAGHPNHRRNTFVCVDKDPESIEGQDADTNGELLYHTSVDCHNLGNCPPYRDNSELACVVCSK